MTFHSTSRFNLFFISLSLIIFCVFSFGGSAVIEVSSQAYLTKYETKKADIEVQKSKVKETLNNVAGKLEETSRLAGTLKEQVAKVQVEIDNTNTAITQTKLIINQLEDQIATNQRDLEELIIQMKELIFDIQKANQVTPLESIVSSGTLGEALSKVYNLTGLQDKAENLRIKILRTRDELEKNRKLAEESRAQLEGAKALLASQKSSLDDLLQKTQNDEENYKRYAKNLEQQDNELNNQIAQAEREKNTDAVKYRQEEERKRIEAEKAAAPTYTGGNGNLNPPAGGTSTRGATTNCFYEDGSNPGIPEGFFGSPTDGYFVREFDGCGHDGVDIANGIGTPLRSIADGVVVKRSYAGNGYGNYTIIKHTLPNGRRIYSLYAHQNSVPIYGIGTFVLKGQQIGYMGTTGRSTGSHLHFSLFSESFEVSLNDGCLYGGWSHSYCYKPSRFVNVD